PSDLAPDLGPHEVGMPLQQLLEEALVAGEAEEPVALLHLLEHARRMDAALPVHDLRAGLEGLAADAVQAAVAALIEIVGVAAEDPLDQVGDSRLVLRRGGADELVVGDAERPPGGLEGRGDLIHERLRGNAPLLRRLGHLLAVLVHADQEPDVVPAKAAVAGDAVGADLLGGGPHVGIAVGVVDGGAEGEPGHSPLWGGGWSRRAATLGAAPATPAAPATAA